MKNTRYNFRPEQWLREKIEKRQIEHPTETLTEAIHNYIANLEKLNAMLKSDCETWKQYAGYKGLTPKVTTFFMCPEMNEKVSLDQCNICKERKLVPSCHTLQDK